MLHPTWNIHLEGTGQVKPSRGLFCGVRGCAVQERLVVSLGAPQLLSAFLFCCGNRSSSLCIKIRDGSFHSFCRMATALGSAGWGQRGLGDFIKQDMEGFRAVLKVDVSAGSPGGEAQPALLELFWVPGW